MILRLATQAMGTRFELVLIGQGGEGEVRLRAAGEEALAEIEECDRRLSRFRRDSVISHLNRGAAAAWVHLDVDTFDLLNRCAELNAATGGAFDPTARRDCAEGVGWENVELDPERCAVRFLHRSTALDLGAIGKGSGLDRAATALREAGVKTALLHGGTSTAVALGAPPRTRGWSVSLGAGIRAPVATLRDCALSVSAQWGPMAVSRPGHVIDPRSGAPASGPCVAAVIADTATDADAWSTALLITGDRPEGIESLTADRAGKEMIWHQPARPSGRFLLSAPADRSAAEIIA